MECPLRIKQKQRTFDYLGNKCSQCGSRDNLEVDHIDPKTKNPKLSYTSGNISIWKLKAKDFEEELPKCQLLCFQCHVFKTANDGNRAISSLHNYSRYKNNGCRCTICKNARKEAYEKEKVKRV